MWKPCSQEKTTLVPLVLMDVVRAFPQTHVHNKRLRRDGTRCEDLLVQIRTNPPNGGAATKLI